jgi:hypothetical protein
MTLFEAKPYDPTLARKRKQRIAIVVSVLVVLAVLWWHFRYWPEEHQVDQFFAALQQQQYEQAYGIWMHDPNWKQHPQQYARYTYSSFLQDWGPGGEWGIIRTYHVDGATTPKGGSSGVVVVVTINGRIERASIWVEKSDKTLGFSPFEAM